MDTSMLAVCDIGNEKCAICGETSTRTVWHVLEDKVIR